MLLRSYIVDGNLLCSFVCIVLYLWRASLGRGGEGRGGKGRESDRDRDLGGV